MHSRRCEDAERRGIEQRLKQYGRCRKIHQRTMAEKGPGDGAEQPVARHPLPWHDTIGRRKAASLEQTHALMQPTVQVCPRRLQQRAICIETTEIPSDKWRKESRQIEKAQRKTYDRENRRGV